MQTCVVHLIRAAMRFVSYNDRKTVAAALRPIYTAPTVEAAESELLAFADSALGRKYPATVATWENAWERFIPFLAFPPELRRIIYTTNADRVAELPAPQDHQEPRPLPQRRRRDQAAVAGHPRHRRQTRPRPRQGEGPAADQRTAPGRLVEGATVQGWKAALGALALAYPDRLARYLT